MGSTVYEIYLRNLTKLNNKYIAYGCQGGAAGARGYGMAYGSSGAPTGWMEPGGEVLHGSHPWRPRGNLQLRGPAARGRTWRTSHRRGPCVHGSEAPTRERRHGGRTPPWVLARLRGLGGVGVRCSGRSTADGREPRSRRDRAGMDLEV